VKTVLIYVITTRLSPWNTMVQLAQETWDKPRVEGVQTWFYSEMNHEPKREHLQCFAVSPGLNNMGHKDIMAYRWALDNLKWDYMARVNASCYVRKQALLDYCQKIPTANLIRGVKASPIFLWGGGQYIMTPDVVKAFVDNAGKWNHKIMEDNAMSELAVELGIPLDGNGRACSINRKDDRWLCIAYGQGCQASFEFRQMEEMRNASDQFFIRCKQDHDRNQDHVIMRELHRLGI